MALIVSQGSAAYLRRVSAMLIRLAALIAVVLMPLGAASTPAFASVASASASEHCADRHEPAESKPQAMDHCVACSALPAGGESPNHQPTSHGPALIHSLAEPFFGIEPDIVTPPPKQS